MSGLLTGTPGVQAPGLKATLAAVRARPSKSAKLVIRAELSSSAPLIEVTGLPGCDALKGMKVMNALLMVDPCGMLTPTQRKAASRPGLPSLPAIKAAVVVLKLEKNRLTEVSSRLFAICITKVGKRGQRRV